MYPPPADEELTEEQARELDDTFLSSDPFQYFRSRIGALLSWQELALVSGVPMARAPKGSARAEFNQYLQRSAVDSPFNVLDVHAQIAADALAVRHHAAESLLRFACARLAPKPQKTTCVWESVATGPTQVKEVIGRLSDSAKAPDAAERMFQLFVAPGARTAARGDADLSGAISVFVAWLNFARSLLSPAQIDLQAANNKIKHGLAVRSRSDMRVTFSTRAPDEDGSVPLETLTGDAAIDIFDQPVLEMLAQGPKVDGHRQGLEITQLRLKPAALLAQAFMLAMAHGAMFHVAAAEHFADVSTSASISARLTFLVFLWADHDLETSTPTRPWACGSRSPNHLAGGPWAAWRALGSAATSRPFRSTTGTVEPDAWLIS